MSHKKCYPCDNFDDLFPCNFGMEHSKAVKLGMIDARKTLISIYSPIENRIQERITCVNFPIYFFHLMKQSQTFCIVRKGNY